MNIVEKFFNNEVIRKYYALRFRVSVFRHRFLARFNLYTHSLVTDILIDVSHDYTCQRAIDDNVYDCYHALYTEMHKILVNAHLIDENAELLEYLIFQLENNADSLSEQRAEILRVQSLQSALTQSESDKRARDVARIDALMNISDDVLNDALSCDDSD